MVVGVCGGLREEIGRLALLNDPGHMRVDKRNHRRGQRAGEVFIEKLRHFIRLLGLLSYDVGLA